VALDQGGVRTGGFEPFDDEKKTFSSVHDVERTVHRLLKAGSAAAIAFSTD